jgi:hypothetical protein
VRITAVESPNSVHSWRLLDGVDLFRGAAMMTVVESALSDSPLPMIVRAA